MSRRCVGAALESHGATVRGARRNGGTSSGRTHRDSPAAALHSTRRKCAPGKTISDRLHDKVAVFTGAGSGIGAACARRFAAEGARVVASDITENASAGTARELFGAGASHIVATGDVTSRKDAEAARGRFVAKYGDIMAR